MVDYLKASEKVVQPGGSEPKVIQALLRAYRKVRAGKPLSRGDWDDAIGQIYGRETREQGDLYRRKRRRFLKSMALHPRDWKRVSRPLRGALNELAEAPSGLLSIGRFRALKRYEASLETALSELARLIDQGERAVLLDNLGRLDRFAPRWAGMIPGSFLIGVHRDPRDHLAERRRQGSRISVERYVDAYRQARIPRRAYAQSGLSIKGQFALVRFESFVLDVGAREALSRAVGLPELESLGGLDPSRSAKNIGIWQEYLSESEADYIVRRLPYAVVRGEDSPGKGKIHG
ncbi:hypothetical protein VCB98_11795 [Gammaproteobacteria bacterium AB-CW1]|uniref:Uncharacterized protein n=1 Tax=Natronospira elongata TaxID=3110268 RepID=A0AAP6JGA3_9GAMM|nr:hypothetical protein [Gammaproteobacteria bacterium AB-CW1]